MNRINRKGASFHATNRASQNIAFLLKITFFNFSEKIRESRAPVHWSGKGIRPLCYGVHQEVEIFLPFLKNIMNKFQGRLHHRVRWRGSAQE